MSIVSDEDQAWANENWFPRAIAGGMRRMAIVVPEKALAKMSIGAIIKKVDEIGLITQYFDSVDKAREWLISE